MKKQFLFTSALALVAMAATSCAKNPGVVYTPGTKLKVGLICLHDNQSTYDKNFITAFENAAKKAKEDGIVEEYAIKTNKAEDQNCADAAEQFVNDGYNMVFSDSFGHDAFIHNVAKDATNVFFSAATGVEAKTAGLKNYHNAFASIYEGRYLAGVAAGLHLRDKKGHTDTEAIKVGYVGAFPYAEVISGYTSWFLGVRKVFPNATMDVKYTMSWYDENGERTAAEALINSGCILISQHADSYGAPSACVADKTNIIPNVSYNMNTAQEKEIYKGSYVAHSRINWEPYYTACFKAMYDGKDIEGETNNNWTGTIATKSVEYNVDSEMVPDRSLIDTLEKDLSEGKMHVFDTSTFTVNDLPRKLTGEGAPVLDKDYKIDTTGHLTMMMGDTDGNYVRDTDLVKDGYINESYHCSAPSFDFIIDGIEIK